MQTYAYMHMCIYMYMGTCAYRCTCGPVRIFVNVQMCICMYLFLKRHKFSIFLSRWIEILMKLPKNGDIVDLRGFGEDIEDNLLHFCIFFCVLNFMVSCTVFMF